MRTLAAIVVVALLALAACSDVNTQSPAAAAVSPSDPPTVPEGRELELMSRVRLDLQGRCAPLRAALVEAALAGVECSPASDVVGRVRLYLFDTQQDLLGAYTALLAANDVPARTNQGRCIAGRASEGGYVPGDGHGVSVMERGACYLDAGGFAHYVATLPPFVLLELDGMVGDVEAVERFAWLGNRDAPGSPTIWSPGGPLSPEK